MRAMRPGWSLESIKKKLKQVRRGAPDQPRPLKRRRTSEVLAEIETAVTGTPRQTLSVLRRHSSLDMSRSTLWRALHEDLQARCFKPVRAPRLTAENRLARLNFCSDVLQRVGVLSIRGKRYLKPLDLTRVVFFDEKFFCWNYTGPSQNGPTRTKGRSQSRCAHQTRPVFLSTGKRTCLSLRGSLAPATALGRWGRRASSGPDEELVCIFSGCVTALFEFELFLAVRGIPKKLLQDSCGSRFRPCLGRHIVRCTCVSGLESVVMRWHAQSLVCSLPLVCMCGFVVSSGLFSLTLWPPGGTLTCGAVPVSRRILAKVTGFFDWRRK